MSLLEILAPIVIILLGLCFLIPSDRAEFEILKDMFKSKKRLKEEEELLSKQMKVFWEEYGQPIHKTAYSIEKKKEEEIFCRDCERLIPMGVWVHHSANSNSCSNCGPSNNSGGIHTITYEELKKRKK